MDSPNAQCVGRGSTDTAPVPCHSVQTRYLIIAALVTGLVILVASTVWFVLTFA